MIFGKRQIVIAALVAALGTAVYLNWQFAGTNSTGISAEDESSVKELGQTTYVNTEIKPESSAQTAAEESKSKATEKTAKANAEVSDDPGNYFYEDRKKRTESNNKAVEALADIIESASSSESAKRDAVKSAEKLAADIKLQSDLEAEIRAKGFKDAFVTINNGNCSVSVYGKKLDDASVITVRDIVKRQAGIEAESILVSEASK